MMNYWCPEMNSNLSGKLEEVAFHGIAHLREYRGTAVAIKEICLACTGVEEDQIKEEILSLRYVNRRQQAHN